jgi:hypothetical protein
MAGKKKGSARRTRADRLCAHFDQTALAGSARPGLDALEAEHKPIVTGGSTIGCGVALDRARQAAEPAASRWDYIFSQRDSDEGLGIEVHHAASTEVEVMIAKKAWAQGLLSRECAKLAIRGWLWLAAPGGDVLFLRQHPLARRLSEAGIGFPRRSVHLP